MQEAMDRDYEAFETPNDEDAYLGHVNDEYIVVSETLPCLHWYAQFLIAYSFFERSLNAFAYSYAGQNGTSLELKDINGRGIDRARRYLSKVCNIEEPFNSLEWQKIRTLSEVRNTIAHRSGYTDYLPDDRGSLYFRLQEDGLELRTEESGQEEVQIFISGDFVLDSIKTFRELLSLVGGLGPGFVTPKHGLPSGGGSDSAR